MGGLGSGRREYATTPTVNECHTLDVNEFTETVDRPGVSATVWWGERSDPAATISLDVLPAASDAVDADRATAFRLRYTVTDGRTDEERKRSYRVGLDYTDCHFGGSRPWFLCPGEGCGERVGKLYRPRSRDLFRCRECHDLAYRSSRVSHDDVEQAELRYRRAFAKADAKDRRPHPNNEPWFPEKPSGMHYDTFDELCQDVRAASQEWDDAMMARVRELADRSQFVDGFDERVS